jgi:predicted transglutaminase-like cysteine proteinase
MPKFVRKLPLIILGVAAFAVASVANLAAMPVAPLNMPALPFQDPSFAPAGDARPAPYGWLHFCSAQPSECEPAQLLPTIVPLTSQSWAELSQINAIANREIAPVGDENHYGIYEQGILNWWTYPDDGKGNCNDYVLLKRRLLIEAGWPKAALLMTVVIDHHGDGHLILMVRTDRGDLILDNMREDIVSWNRTGYRFVKRQSALNHNDWVSIQAQGDSRMVAVSNPR